MESAVQVIVVKLGQLVADEIRKARAVSGEVVHLRNELATMNAALLMLSEADDSAVDHLLREWGRQVRDLAFDIEDCIDLFKYGVSHFRPMFVGANHVYRMIQKFRLRSSLFEDVQALRARAVIVGECHARYVVTRQALGARSAVVYSDFPVRRVAAPENSTYDVGVCRAAANDRFIHNREQVEILGKWMTDPCKDLKVLPIVGIDGIGKTTLAMEACRQLEWYFDCQAHVSVSQAFDANNDLKGLLKRLLKHIWKEKKDYIFHDRDGTGNIHNMDVNRLTGVLGESLRNKRYLILIDDVRTIPAWIAIESKLPYNNKGSRIMVTTPIETVARACSGANDYIYHIKPLDMEASMNLFLDRTFGSLDRTCPVELETVMEGILRKCAGLPLVIVSIAGLLVRYRWPDCIDMWETVYRSMGSQMGRNPTMEGLKQILTLSYNHLPHHLKACTMYLSILPEYYLIKKDKLLYRWIIEGLVVETRGLTLYEVAEHYFDELVSRGMIICDADIIGSYASEEMCWVQGMMLEVLVSKSLEVNFVSLVGGSYKGRSYDRIRRLSIHGEDERIMNMQHVRSLTMFQSEGHKLLDRLGEFTLLSVLDLQDYKGLKDMHLKDICKMYLLKYLCLKGTYISVMPEEVGELEHLRMLDVRDTCLHMLPKTVRNLEKLERLLFSHKTERSIMWMPPYGIEKMKALHEVSSMVVKNDIQVAQEIGKLEHLQRLTVYVDCNEPDVHEDLQKLALSLHKIQSLRFLTVGAMGNGGNALDFLLHTLWVPRFLRFLRIAGGLNGFPRWIGSLPYLVEFHISSAHLVDDFMFKILCKCPNLKTIVLERDFYTSEELVARRTFVFRELGNLDVSSDSEHPKIIRFEKGSMTNLEKLSVNFSTWDKKSIFGVQYLTNLKKIQLTGKKDNPALAIALEELNRESVCRPGDEQFKVVVKYQ